MEEPHITADFTDELLRLRVRINAMFEYAFRYGISVEPELAEQYFQSEHIDNASLTKIYNYLIDVVKPAHPRYILQVYTHRHDHFIFRLFGNIPFVRALNFATLMSLVLLIGLSLTSFITTDSRYSFVDGSWQELLAEELFILSAAAVGAGIAALTEANRYLKDSSWDDRYHTCYATRYFLGIVSGFVLAMMLPIEDWFTEPELKKFGGMLYPTIALLCGYSGNLVQSILNRLVVSVETVFRGSVEEQRQFLQEQVSTESEKKRLAEKLELLNQLQSITADKKLDAEGIQKRLTELYASLTRNKG
ncbi:hypothetical protein [Bowmanella sp. JS7-9]|uniref:Uncharacterized protein n=1 Tax=Pseudobowmanella zhangzhouensis TaxID=1537679 RepID=A0ABW1XJY5_9ALTE|nr:hypothetical protein [Bowmanella sp. JS7-9]TBX26045.1 hypothetical protein TK45_02260 [Bowmanella sp. JS7-9]